MFMTSKQAEVLAIANAASSICAAARTAPKACGIDHLDTAVVSGEEKAALAEEMRRLCNYDEKNFMYRDSNNVDDSDAVVLIGVKESTRGLGRECSLCHFDGCKSCEEAGGCCVFDLIDLGIAIGSAVSVAADLRIDNRVMYTAGKAAASLGYLGDYKTIMGIPLSAKGKAPYFDRKQKK